jgi:folate-binding protein YgfZ
MPSEVYKMIRIAGSDAGEFLQGQLTQDMKRLLQIGSLPAAWCNPQGRVISLLRILITDDGYGLVLPASVAETVCKQLTVYRLRANVSIEVAGSDWTCLVFNTNADMNQLEKLGLRPKQEINACRIDHGLIAINIGIEEQCVELMGFCANMEKIGIEAVQHTKPDFLRVAKIRAGIPEILSNQSENYTPHMLNLDLLGAVSFDKGCYTGQEVVTRTQFLGNSKRRLMRYRIGETVAACGDKISDGQRNVGEVINVSGNNLLAVTPVELHDKALLITGVKVIPAPLPYSIPDF